MIFWTRLRSTTHLIKIKGSPEVVLPLFSLKKNKKYPLLARF